MEITKENFEDNIKALKAAINEKVVLKKDAKGEAIGHAIGHVFCDVVQLSNTKIDGYSKGEVIKKNVLVEAKHALHVTENYKTTNKVYIIVK